jgi:hypothetical protein
MTGRSETFDIVLHLTTVGAAKADDPSHFATIHKGHVLPDCGIRRARDHSHLLVLKPFINPHQRGLPIEFACHERGHPVFRLVRLSLGWIEFDSDALL